MNASGILLLTPLLLKIRPVSRLGTVNAVVLLVSLSGLGLSEFGAVSVHPERTPPSIAGRLDGGYRPRADSEPRVGVGARMASRGQERRKSSVSSPKGTLRGDLHQLAGPRERMAE